MLWQMAKFCSSCITEWCSVAYIIYTVARIIYIYVYIYIYIYIHIHIHIYIYTVSSLSIHLLMGNLGCFHILAIVINATVNIGVHVSFQISLFASFGY